MTWTVILLLGGLGSSALCAPHGGSSLRPLSARVQLPDARGKTRLLSSTTHKRTWLAKRRRKRRRRVRLYHWSEARARLSVSKRKAKKKRLWLITPVNKPLEKKGKVSLGRAQLQLWLRSQPDGITFKAQLQYNGRIKEESTTFKPPQRNERKYRTLQLHIDEAHAVIEIKTMGTPRRYPRPPWKLPKGRSVLHVPPQTTAAYKVQFENTACRDIIEKLAALLQLTATFDKQVKVNQRFTAILTGDSAEQLLLNGCKHMKLRCDIKGKQLQISPAGK